MTGRELWEKSKEMIELRMNSNFSNSISKSKDSYMERSFSAKENTFKEVALRLQLNPSTKIVPQNTQNNNNNNDKNNNDGRNSDRNLGGILGGTLDRTLGGTLDFSSRYTPDGSRRSSLTKYDLRSTHSVSCKSPLGGVLFEEDDRENNRSNHEENNKSIHEDDNYSNINNENGNKDENINIDSNLHDVAVALINHAPTASI